MSRYRQKHQHDYHADFQIELSHFELSSPNTLLNWTFNNLFLFFIYNWRILNKFQRHQKLKLFLFTEEGDCAKSPADVHRMMRWESLQRLFIHEMRRTWKLRNSDASGDSLRFFKAPPSPWKKNDAVRICHHAVVLPKALPKPTRSPRWRRLHLLLSSRDPHDRKNDDDWCGVELTS